MRSLRVAAVLTAALSLTSVAGQQPAQPPTQAQQRPVFRAGTHFVRVDAYPVRDGKIVADLAAEDFEIFEDGKPQKIESFDFLKFDTFTPDVVRRDPRSQREGFDMAADPRYRVFVIAVDMVFSGRTDIHHIQQPLVQFLQRVLGPMDLFGFITSRNSVKDLVLMQKSTVVESQVADLFRSANIDRDDADELFRCGCGNATEQQCEALIAAMKARHRADQTYVALEGLVQQLGSLRQERKNVVFVTNYLPRTRPDTKLLETRGPTLPKVGITNGRLGVGDRNRGVEANEGYCVSEFQRLAMMDFDSRYRELLRDARKENVSFYIITSAGLQANPNRNAQDDLIALANETDGLAIVNTNDLNGGMKRIADDLAAYYLLGYYTTNTQFDGRLRNITVRLKTTGKAVRARRQYRAPTREEIAALSGAGGGRSAAAPASSQLPSPVASALATLDGGSLTPKADVPAGALVAEPRAFRVGPRMAPQPVTVFQFDRTDRIRIEWALLGAPDRRQLRMLDRTGKPLPVDLPLSEDPASRMLVVEFSLAPFSRGDYVIELTAGVGAAADTKLLAFRIR